MIQDSDFREDKSFVPDSAFGSDRAIRRGILELRLLDFGVRIIKVVKALPRNDVGNHIARQLLRSGTSAGANYGEACGAESRADFIHKMQIVLKELQETKYWLMVTARASIVPAKRLDPIIQESDELIAISVKSLLTARRGSANAKES